MPSNIIELGDSRHIKQLKEAADYFLSANQLAIKEWQQIRMNKVIESSLDETRIKEFTDKCVKGWQDQSWAVNLFSTLNLIEERGAKSGEIYAGFHRRMPKDAFIKEPDAIYLDFGRTGELQGSCYFYKFQPGNDRRFLRGEVSLCHNQGSHSQERDYRQRHAHEA